MYACLHKVRQMLFPPRLLDVPELIRYHPGTKKNRVSYDQYRKYVDACNRFSEYLALIGKDDNPPVTAITREDYAGWHDWLATRDTAVSTINGYRSRGSAIFNALRKKYGINVCDIEGITNFEPNPHPRNHAITEDHLTQILQFATVRDTAIILYMLDGGFRRQTVPRLTVENTYIWQRPDGQFRIASHIPKEKTSPPRVVMGENDTAVAVQNWLNIREFKTSPWIFYNTYNGEQLTAAAVSEIFKSLRRRCSIPGWNNVNAHALRHKFAQNRADKGDDIKTIADWMGISTDTLVKVYLARDLDDLVKARFGDNGFPREVLKGR